MNTPKKQRLTLDQFVITSESLQNRAQSLVGWFFVTLNDEKEIDNQGRIEELVSKYGDYVVCVFSWLTGSPNGYYTTDFDNISKHFVFTGKTQDEHSEFCERNNGKKVHRPHWAGRVDPEHEQ